MASSSDIIRSILDCPDCQCVLTDPCTLECGHSFCAKCLRKYAQNDPVAVSRSVLPCSICRHETRVPDPSLPADQWSKHLAPSMTIRTLVEQIQKQEDTEKDEDKNCFLCSGVGETTPGVSWCLDCELTLCDRCSRIHKITPGMVDHEQCKPDERSKVKTTFKVKCPQHKDIIKYYCCDCEKACCNVCCTLLHRMCKKVVTVDSVFQDMRLVVKTNYEKVLSRLYYKEILLNTLNSLKDDIQRDRQSTESSIRSFEKKVLNIVSNKFQDVVDKLNQTVEEEQDFLTADITTTKADIRMYQQHREVLKQALEECSLVKLFSTHQFCQCGDLFAEDSRVNRARKCLTELSYSLDLGKINRALSDLDLGEVSLMLRNVGQVTSSLEVSDVYVTELYRKIDTMTNSDVNKPGLLDLTVLMDGERDRVIVIDWFNTSVKAFWTESNESRQSVFNLGGQPGGITQVDVNKVMVTLPHDKKLVTLNVNPDLVKDKVIKTQKEYWSLCTFGSGRLVAGSERSRCVDVLLLEKDSITLVKTLDVQPAFTSPWYLAVSANDSNRILVSDCRNHTVTCLTSECDVMWKYSPPQGEPFKPGGITTNVRGDVLIVDGHSHKIIVLTGTGEFKTDITMTSGEETSDPLSVHCDDRGYMFITERDGRVLVYSFTNM